MLLNSPPPAHTLFLCRELLDWTAKTCDAILLEPLSANSLVEEVLRRHAEVRDQIQAKDYEFAYVEELGGRLMAKGAASKGVKARLTELTDARERMDAEWTRRERECRQVLELQVRTINLAGIRMGLNASLRHSRARRNALKQ